MKTNHLIVGALAISLLAGASVPVTQASSFNGFSRGGYEKSSMMSEKGNKGNKEKEACGMMDKMPGKNVEINAAMKTLMTELRTAQKAGDAAKVTELRAKITAQREVDQKAQQAAMDAALAGGYETWKAFALKQGMPEAMISKITADNFATFAELHNTQKKVRELHDKLGFPGMGMGGGMGGGHMRGR